MSLDKVADRVSRRPTLLIATAAATLLIALPALRITLLERKLARKITYHRTLLGDTARELLQAASTTTAGASNSKDDGVNNHQTLISPPYPTSLSTLPHHLITTPNDHNIFYDISLLPIPSSTLPPSLNPQDLLTTYLQHNMQLFASSPQGWVLWATQRGRQGRRSFEREWIESLGFEKGELVCGVYSVVERGGVGEGGAKVVFEMSRGKVEGRLVIGVRKADGEMLETLVKARDGGHGSESIQETVQEQEKDVMVFGTETWMWVRKDTLETMPMQMAVPRFMHRLLSWRLLVSGTEHLQRLAR
jgi:hypothetical protein